MGLPGTVAHRFCSLDCTVGTVVKLRAKCWHLQVNSHYTSLSAILDVTSEFSGSEGGT